MKLFFSSLFTLLLSFNLMASPAQQTSCNKKDIVDTAIKNGNFKTLVTALKATNLVDALRGEGPLTVFAPTDEAFDKLPEGTLEALLDDPEKLKSILLYHVSAGKALAQDVITLDEVSTLNGKTVMIDITGGKVFLNGDSQVIKTDVEATNGVIHVIDRVLIP